MPSTAVYFCVIKNNNKKIKNKSPMKYSKEMISLLGHLNPSIYDFIFPHGPVQQVQATSKKDFVSANYQTQGSIYGTDFSGELHLLAKLTWKMKNLTEDLRAVIIQSKLSGQEGKAEGFSSFVSEIADEYCGTVTRIPFPPKPHWFDDTLTIQERVAAATIFSQAAATVKGTELETFLSKGADRILDSALTEFKISTAGSPTRNIEAIKN